MSIPTPEDMPLLLVFDIDETLIQFINNSKRFNPSPYYHWKNITKEQKNKFLNLWDDEEDDYKNPLELREDKIFYLEKRDKHAKLFRPGLAKFIQKVNKEPRLFIGLWTLSDTDYAEAIRNSLFNIYGLKKDKCLFAYGADESDQGYDTKPPKKLSFIWNQAKYKNRFNKFNTILIDDRLGNLNHETNHENSILIEEFAPFGPKKEREPLIDAKLDHALHDKAFNELSKIVDKVLSYNSGCDEEECNDAFFSEPVFPMHNRNKLRKLGVEPNIINEEPLITIGDVHNSANPSKGGKHKRTQKKKRIQKKKSYKKKKQTYKKKSYKKK